MASQLPFIFRASPLPSNFRGTPQQFMDALVARLSAESEVEIAVFVTGSVEPASNVGPWLKDGTTWYVWDDVTGSYIPQILEQSSLGYIVGSVAPDPDVYQFWIETAVGGEPLALKTYFDGAWTDVYANALGDYLTVAAFNAAIAAYSTTAQMNTAISNAIAAALVNTALTGVPTAPTAAPGTNTAQLATTAFVTAAVAAVPTPTAFAAYPAQGIAASQVIAINGTPQQIEFDSTTFNPSPGPFNTGTFRYVAPAAGYYDVAFASQFDNDTGSASGMEVVVGLYKNGVSVGSAMGDIDNTPSPNGSRWSPGFSGLIQLAATDYIEVFAVVTDGVNAGNITLTVAQLSVNRVQST